jgi:hypothetical protein
MLKVALATCSALPDGWPDDRLLTAALRERGAEASFEVWSDGGVEWRRFDRIVVRSTWDYTDRRDDFLAWAEGLGERLRNPPDVLRWNSEKRYLGELAAAGIPVVPTTFVEPTDPEPRLEGQVVVKPAVSAGARDTGRFGPAVHEGARALLVRLQEAGRTAMVQPYLDSVDREGETALVFVDGSLSHVLSKRPVLRPDEEAPTRDDAIGAAEIMYDEGLVGRGEATEEQEKLAAEILDWLRRRFGAVPLYARVDMLRDGAGAPVLVELEAVEPCLYLAAAPSAAGRLAEAVLAGR